MIKKIGGIVYDSVIVRGEDPELVLKFKLSDSDKTKGRTLTGIEGWIEAAFRAYAEAPTRREREREEREGAGVDPYVLGKIRTEIDKLLQRFDNRTISASKALESEVRSFSVGQRVRLRDNLKEVGGKEGVVLARRKRYLTVEIEGKRWKVGPALIISEEAANG